MFVYASACEARASDPTWAGLSGCEGLTRFRRGICGFKMPTDICDIENQSPAYENVDLFGSDRALQEAVAANGAEETAALSKFGRRWGSAEMFEQARLANDNPPKLRAFDARGDHSDVVEFHPAYHGFMAESIAAGLHALTWRAGGGPAVA